MHKLDDLRQLKRGLVERIGTKLEMRTARKWYNEGELSSKYFFNLLTRKANNEINCIVRDNGEELKKDVDIENQTDAIIGQGCVIRESKTLVSGALYIKTADATRTTETELSVFRDFDPLPV